MIPLGINCNHVLTALSQIDRDGVPAGRTNRSVELRHDGKGYPPKLVISVAFQVATGRALPSSAFITTEAERYLSGLGFSVVRLTQLVLGETEGIHSVMQPMVKDLLSPELESLVRELLYSARLYRWSELKNNPTLPPRSTGVYAWFFNRVPAGVPTDSCLVREGTTLLYVGETGKKTLWDRLKSQHFGGNAESSTLRQTLGCLLEGELGTVLMLKPGSGKPSKTFMEKEGFLTGWMADNARVAWVKTPKPQILEDHLLKTQGRGLPLNIKGNPNNPFRVRLKELREKALRRAEQACGVSKSLVGLGMLG